MEWSENRVRTLLLLLLQISTAAASAAITFPGLTQIPLLLLLRYDYTRAIYAIEQIGLCSVSAGASTNIVL